MGFSQGASLAATLILRDQEAGKHKVSSDALRRKPFKCAIFLSGQLPFDCSGLERGEIRQLKPETDKAIIDIPTAHLWGKNDTLYPDISPKLAGLCATNKRIEVTHMAGHGIPSRGFELEEMAEAFSMTLRRAE